MALTASMCRMGMLSLSRQHFRDGNVYALGLDVYVAVCVGVLVGVPAWNFGGVVVYV